MKAIVVAGGDAVATDAALLSGADVVIAADSGAHWLDAWGHLPDLVIGDMDSIDPALLERLVAKGIEVERHPTDKDASDVELAVSRAVADGADQVVILGAIGGERLDHQLANLLLLVDRGWVGIDLRAIRAGTSVRALRAGARLELDGVVGGLVSLLPIEGDATGVRTVGLRYRLDGEILQSGRSRGLSNQIEKAPASVSLEGGALLIIETRKEPRA